MVFVSQEERIQRRLLQEAATGPFHLLQFDRDTHQMRISVPIELQPAEAIAVAVSSTFGEPLQHRRTARLERQSWRWQLECRFDEQVSTEEFEKRIIQSYIILARDVDNDLEQVTLKLLSADGPLQPPQQAPSTGTQVTFTFEAELSPV